MQHITVSDAVSIYGKHVPFIVENFPLISFFQIRKVIDNNVNKKKRKKRSQYENIMSNNYLL